jgi:parallel beta-helix repeat protein
MKNNIISESGSDAVIFQDCGNIDYKKNIIINTNSNALGFYNCKYITASYNEIKNTALRAGMGSGYMGVNMHYKVENCLFENNLIDSVGYDGIRFGGDNITIRNNVITNFCMILDDGGGIYTGGDELLQYHDRQIQNNIILNGIGAGEGTDLPTYLPAEGIYIDDCSINTTIINNSVANCNRGIFIHNANTISIIGNTLYNNETQLLLAHNWTAPECPINQCVIKENIYFSKLKSQVVADFMTIENDIQNFGTIDYNYYCRPIDDDLTIYSLYIGNSGTTSSFMNLATWQSTFNYDLNSKKSLFTVPAYHITNLRGTSKLENGKFNSDIEGWNYWSNYDNGYATWDNNNDLDGGCLKLGFNITSGKADGLVLSYVSFSEAIAGENYILKFSMVASTTGKRVKIYMRDNDSPRNYITPVQYVYSDTKRTEHELHFVPDSTKTNARIDFEIKDDDGPIWIDNVELYNADVKTTNMDDHVKFLYNPGISALAFNVGGNCYDVKGNKYGSFILQPYTSVILMSTSPITNMNIKQTYNSFIVYPNPVNNLLFISTTDTLKETVIIIDISGRVVYEEDRNSGNLAIDVSSLSKGIFLIQLKDYKNIATAKFIKN